MMETSERNIAILEARLSGRTLKDVADEFGITGDRVRQIACRFIHNSRKYDKLAAECERLRVVAENAILDARKSKTASPVGRQVSLFELPLSVRSFNCLKNGGYETVQQVYEARDFELLSLPGLGRKSLREIRLVVGGL